MREKKTKSSRRRLPFPPRCRGDTGERGTRRFRPAGMAHEEEEEGVERTIIIIAPARLPHVHHLLVLLDFAFGTARALVRCLGLCEIAARAPDLLLETQKRCPYGLYIGNVHAHKIIEWVLMRAGHVVVGVSLFQQRAQCRRQGVCFSRKVEG